MTEATTIDEKKEPINLSKEAQGIVDSIEKMSVLELSELVKVLEDKFGVVAAAPMMAAGVPQAGAAEEADAGSAVVDVILKSCGDKKIQVLKAVRELTGLGLKEAKELVDNVPKAVKEGVDKEEAEKIKKSLEEQGAEIEVK